MKSLYLLIIILVLPTSMIVLHSCRKGEMKVETTDVSKVMATIATAQAYILDLGEGVDQHGHCWDTTANPTINSNKTENGPASGTGSFASNLTDLKQATTYHIRAYLQTDNVVVYGRDITFTTLDGKSTLKTSNVKDITAISARSGGNIVAVNGDSVLQRGVCWDTTEAVNLLAKSGFTVNGRGLGIFNSELSDLIPGRTYYVKAYAISGVDTSYGETRSFTTLNGKATIITLAASKISATTALTGGNITFYGGLFITVRGVCYDTSESPTLDDNITTDGFGFGSYTSSVNGLSPNTTYYIRAYATNAFTTTYGDQQTFLTKGLPELTTANITNITNNTVTGGGNITGDEGYPVTARGVCWSTSPNPTISDSKTIDGSGTGSFISSISGLTQGFNYNVRAYATNITGTQYGKEVSFKAQSPGTVTDIDGNVYKTVTVGIQIWMAENLRTSHYNDGTPITLVTDSAWATLMTPRSDGKYDIQGAYCWYNNDKNFEIPYGKLYNFGAVETGKLCPAGWHVPDGEFGNLIEPYKIWEGSGPDAGYGIIGNELIEQGTSHWTSSIGTNETGFTAVPAGMRNSLGQFSGLGNQCTYWTSYGNSDLYRGEAVIFFLPFSAYLSPTVLHKAMENGYSIRCIKD